MTNDEIRIKITKSLGWKRDNSISTKPGEEKPWKHPLCARWQSELPNYPESLDACAEFEATLTEDEYTAYSILLVNETVSKRKLYAGVGSYVYKKSDCIPVYCMARAVSATPIQRCLAYLKTKGFIP